MTINKNDKIKVVVPSTGKEQWVYVDDVYSVEDSDFERPRMVVEFTTLETWGCERNTIDIDQILSHKKASY